MQCSARCRYSSAMPSAHQRSPQFKTQPARSIIRESRTYRRHPQGPSARSFKSGPFHRSGCPRDAAARAALTATDAIATSSTMARRFPVAFQRGKCRRNTVFNCCSHSPGRKEWVTVCDAGWTRNALNVSAMKRIGPLLPVEATNPNLPYTRAPHPIHRSQSQRFAGTRVMVSRWSPNQKALDESIRQHNTFRKRTSPRSEPLRIGTYKHRIVKHERGFRLLHLTPKSRNPARQPKVILMKKAGPISPCLTQSEIGGRHPISDSAGGDQSNRKKLGKVTHDVESAI